MTLDDRTDEIAALFDDLSESWRPGSSTEIDDLDPVRAEQLAATLNLQRTPSAGTPLPLTWQWIYFPQWPPTETLGTDGHPLAGHFLPPVPNRTRMFAGARMTVTHPLILGQQTVKHSAVTSVRHKHGHTGHLLFVAITNTFAQAGRDCLVEQQDIVYRSGTTTVSPPAHTDDLAPCSAQTSMEPNFDSTTLFRYSALTANSHRIHYDHPYATQVEGYPALVVHGPLLATHMANLAEPDSTMLQHFEFRLKAPVFLGDKIRIEAHPDPGGATTALTVVSAHDTVHATAVARFSN
jgi:3-methylfumaryl-CoA hydratase